MQNTFLSLGDTFFPLFTLGDVLTVSFGGGD